MRSIDTARPEEFEALARRRVARKMGFLIHAAVYVAVNFGLFTIDALNGGRHWAHFPLLGWGLGLAIHGVVTFAAGYGDTLHRKLLAREMNTLRRVGR